MSNLLSQASLVMIPSGYKEDVVYSAIPTNGNGDLSFTRASNGTRVNSAGLVEVVPWNLLQYSEDFTNGFWTQNNCTVTANNTTAPNGTNTADLITSTSTSETGIFILPSFDGTNTWSVYAKKGTGRYLFFNTNTPLIAAKFDLQDGVIVGTPSAGASPSIESIGNGWYRCIITSSTATNRFTAFITNNTTTSDLTSSVGLTYYLWGAQVNTGALKPYFPTTDRLNVPRLTYQNGGGGCPSLLLEKQSTNLVSYSQDFTNAYWSKLGQGIADTAVVTANYAISPDGTQNATRFVCNLNGGTTSAARSWMIASFAAPATSTISIWIKLNSAGTKTFVFSDSSGDTKTISGTDWQRIDGTFVGAGGEFRIGLIGGSSSDTLDCSIWGAQAESGSYPTSYIPTTSSSATRVADACSKTGISSLIGQTEGVLFLDFNYIATTNTSDTTAIRLLGSGSAGMYLEINSNNTFEVAVVNSLGSLVFNSSSSAQTAGRYKFAIAYNANDYAFYLNGTQIAVDTSGAFASASLDSLNLGMYQSGSQLLDGSINQVALFPTRLTNAELASLTTI